MGIHNSLEKIDINTVHSIMRNPVKGKYLLNIMITEFPCMLLRTENVLYRIECFQSKKYIVII